MITAAIIEEPTGYRAVLRAPTGARLYSPEVRGREEDAILDAQFEIDRIADGLTLLFKRRRPAA